jgi:hypothetical protein
MENYVTPQEFKAWFEGFTEAFDRIPTKAQWARVKERVAEIDGEPVTERVFVDRYWPSRYHEYRPYWAYYSSGGLAAGSCSNLSALSQQSASAPMYQNAVNQMSQGTFNSGQAMLALGRADAEALNKKAS